MEIVRLDSYDTGVVYVRANKLMSLAPVIGEDQKVRTQVRFLLDGFGYSDVIMDSDPDEVAMLFERGIPDLRIIRIG